jgi:HEAT repeat protein
LAATRDSSNLLAHEAAFALGQMQEQEAIPALTSVLNDLSLHPIVRHEVVEKTFYFFLFFSSFNLLVFLSFKMIVFVIILLRQLKHLVLLVPIVTFLC